MAVFEYTRLFADEQGESRFEEIKINLTESGPIGYLSETYQVKELQFRVNDAGYDWDFHNAPGRQFIILLDGEIEITSSLGDSRTFRGGDVILVEDTVGKGHKTRNTIKQIRKSIIIRI
jgi:quercetin dioxygenase-like cupin family protein